LDLLHIDVLYIPGGKITLLVVHFPAQECTRDAAYSCGGSLDSGSEPRVPVRDAIEKIKIKECNSFDSLPRVFGCIDLKGGIIAKNQIHSIKTN
jgi:hypothetical protein